MRKIIIYPIILMVILMSGVGFGAISEESYIQVRDSSNWNLYQDNAKLINQNPDPAEPGEYVEIRVKVENIGSDESSNMLFKLIPDYPFSLDPGDSGIVKIGDIEGRQVGEEAYVLYWKIRVANDAVEGNNKINIKYTEDEGASWQDLTNFYVRIQTHDAIISVDSINTYPKLVAPGQEFQMNITITNMADSVIKDVKTSLNLIYPQLTTIVNLPFTPIGSTNEKVTKIINSGNSVELSFNMVADSDASSGIYKIPITVKYSDELAKNYTFTGIVAGVIGSQPELFVTADMVDLSNSKNKIPIDIKFVNKGKEDIKFLFTSVGEVKGLEFVSSHEEYIGNIDSDDYETQTYYVNVDDCNKKYNLPISIEYADTNNIKYQENVILDLKVCDASAESEGKINWVGIIIVIAIIVAALLIYRAFKKKK